MMVLSKGMFVKIILMSIENILTDRIAVAKAFEKV